MIKKLLSFLILCLATLTLIGTTYALPVVQQFKDLETSNNNTFSATTLDFSLTDTSNNPLAAPLINITDMKPGDLQTETIRIKKDGLLDFKYNITAVQTGGDASLCTALQVEANIGGGATEYSGSLTGLNLAPAITISGSEDDWDLTVSLTDSTSELQNKSCQFNFVVSGWQTDSDGTWGLSDQESVENTIASGAWVTFGDVVINEIMWMGSSTSSADEWIELRNTTAGAINLTGWKIENAGEGAGISVTLSGTIPANGFFLLSNYATGSSAISDSITADQNTTDVSLLDGGEQLTLKTAGGTTIDQTPVGAWAAGVNGGPDWKSMERNDDPSTGWHTCTDSACNDVAYWDSEGNNYGTPKAANLSSNDPSSSDYVSPPVPTPDPLITPEATPSASINTDLTPEASESASPTPTPTPTEEPSPSPTPVPIEPAPEPIVTPQPEGETASL